MAKTHAQRQKEYRERKKLEPESNWLELESKRTKAYYKKTSSLSTREANDRRKRVRKNVKKHRMLQKARLKTDSSSLNIVSSTEMSGNTGVMVLRSNEVSSTSDTSLPSTSNDKTQTTPQHLVVKLPAVRKRINRTVSKQKRTIKRLEDVNLSLKKKNATLRKQMSRLKNVTLNMSKSPKTKTDKEMRASGISPRKFPNIRRQLILKNSLTEEIGEAVKENPEKTNVIRKIITGRIIRKYRLGRSLSSATKLNLRNFSDKKNIKFEKKKTKKTYSQLSKEVRNFLEREDNSRQMPGKADAVKGEDKVKIQKFVLNDYLHNLHLKFVAENSAIQISRATFSRLRPKHISLVNFAARVTCLCTRHQNFALKLQCLKKLGVNNETSPDKFADSVSKDTMSEMLSKIEQNMIEFKQWKRITCEDGKQRTKLLDCKTNKEEFKAGVLNQFEEFCQHTERVKVQYNSFKTMKDKIPEFKNHVCIQMDFAENYGIKEMEEIQSAYWNPEMVTLHPVIIYFCNEAGHLSHKCYVVISEILHHNSSMVRAIIDKIIPQVRAFCPDVKFIHYWTDSPTSQYRNKSIFDLIASHSKYYGIKASWQYFESGHGKGACDGLGGVAKRTADNAIKTGKATIQSARDFYNWASSIQSEVTYIYVEKDEYETAKSEIDLRQKDLLAVKGTLKVHSVAGISEYKIMTRETTCICQDCFKMDGFNIENDKCKWNLHYLRKPSLRNTGDSVAVERQNVNVGTSREVEINVIVESSVEVERSQNVNVESTVERGQNVNVESTVEVARGQNVNVESSVEVERGQNVNVESSKDVDYCVNSYVAALYEGKPYIGKVIDKDDSEYEITFMAYGSKIKECLYWPRNEDIIWVSKAQVICDVATPQPSGKGKRLFRLTEADRFLVDSLMKKTQKH